MHPIVIVHNSKQFAEHKRQVNVMLTNRLHRINAMNAKEMRLFSTNMKVYSEVYWARDDIVDDDDVHSIDDQ